MSNLNQTASISDPSSQTDFSREVLTALKAPESLGNIIFLNSWQQREEPDYTASPGLNNPLNLETSGDLGQNGVFANYSTMQVGAQSTADLILNGYPSIAQALQQGTAYEEDAKGSLAADFQKWSRSKTDPGYTSVTLTEDNLTSKGSPATGQKLTTGSSATGGGNNGWESLVTGFLGLAGSPSAAPTLPGGVLGSGEISPGNVIGDVVSPGAAASSSSISGGITADLEIAAFVLGAGVALFLAVSHLTTGGLTLPGVGTISTGGGSVPELWWCIGAFGVIVLWSIFTKQSPSCSLKHLTAAQAGNCQGTLQGGNVLSNLSGLFGKASTVAGAAQGVTQAAGTVTAGGRG